MVVKWRGIKGRRYFSCYLLSLKEDQLGLSLLTLEQLESEEAQKKIESRVHQQ